MFDIRDVMGERTNLQMPMKTAKYLAARINDLETENRQLKRKLKEYEERYGLPDV